MHSCSVRIWIVDEDTDKWITEVRARLIAEGTDSNLGDANFKFRGRGVKFRYPGTCELAPPSLEFPASLEFPMNRFQGWHVSVFEKFEE